ncbi:hypothetical protein TNCV_4230991 [Trichonephila clavipes]|uniref:Uncharacterized protein n=1 Tax=Trichonephila clavipes TaxID=2585209 RepID=A0A8X6VM81_TRICX|nr:hypothetical protein TNCV_4230991 [Trichonephila clavipes]
MHRCPTRWVFSGTRPELATRTVTIRYLDHSATAATLWWPSDHRREFVPALLLLSCEIEPLKTIRVEGLACVKSIVIHIPRVACKEDNTCANGGTCRNNECDCEPGYEGEKIKGNKEPICDPQISKCILSSQINRGMCKDDGQLFIDRKCVDRIAKQDSRGDTSDGRSYLDLDVKVVVDL